MIDLIIVPDPKDSEIFHAYKEVFARGRKVGIYHVFSVHGDMLHPNVPYIEAMNGKGREARFTLTPKV